MVPNNGAVRPFYGLYADGMLLADLHIHTRRSDGWWRPEAVAETAVSLGLSAIAITDHDDCSAGYSVADYCSRRGLPLTVYPGAEISSREDGHDVHVIGLNLVSDIKPWQSIAATVNEILKQGAIPVLAHPKAPGGGRPTFDQIMALQVPVAVEIYNASVSDLHRFRRRLGDDPNVAARAFYETYGARLLGAIGGTDAHFRTIGRGLTAYHGDLLEAIKLRQTAVALRDENERLRPWDLVGYFWGLRKLDRRRSRKWNVPRPKT
jgi:hypothetical protein